MAAYQTKYQHGDKRVWLVDTPGFGDTEKEEIDTLKTISKWLTKTYKEKNALNAVIYMFPITERKFTLASKKALEIFKGICGSDFMDNVVLTTTLWEVMRDEKTCEKRESQLTSNYWKPLMNNGAKYERYERNNVEDAHDLMFCVAHKAKLTCNLQRQAVDEGKPLSQTDAGRVVDEALIKERKKWLDKLQEAKMMMDEAIAAKDRQSQQMLRQHEEEMKRKIADMDRTRESLRVDFDNRRREQDEYMKRRTAEMEQERELRRVEAERRRREDEQRWAREMDSIRNTINQRRPPQMPAYQSYQLQPPRIVQAVDNIAGAALDVGVGVPLRLVGGVFRAFGL